MQEVVTLPAKADTPQGLAETVVIPFTGGGWQTVALTLFGLSI